MNTKKSNRFYIYVYMDPRNPGSYTYDKYTFGYEPFYIGKGQGSRINDHIKECKRLILNNEQLKRKKTNLHKTYKIINILKAGLKPIILKIEKNLIEQVAFDLEIWMIWAVGRSDLKLGPLTNLTDGGEGGGLSDQTIEKIRNANLGRNHSDETRKKLSFIHKERYSNDPILRKFAKDHMNKIRPNHIGMKRSEETKQKQSDAAKGKIVSEETKKKLSKTSMGRKHSEETKKLLSILNSKSKPPGFGKLISEKRLNSVSIGKTYEITFPDGHLEVIRNINKFCRRNNLNYRQFEYMLKKGHNSNLSGYFVKIA